MVEDDDDDKENKVMVDLESPEKWLEYANDLVPLALEKARVVKGFKGRWKTIISKLEQIPSRLSDLSSHPCFTKNALCKEQLQAISKTLNESLEMAEKCCKDKQEGKLQMQSDLDALSGNIDLLLRDCGLLIKTGILGEAASSGVESISGSNIAMELLARLQIGHLEAKHKALDNLVELMREDEKAVLPFLGRSSLSALVQLLAATSPIIREKAVTLICTLAEAGTCNSLLVSEGVLPPLIRLLESGSAVGREKSAITLQRLSMSGGEIARSIVGHGGVQPLVEVCCCTGDSVSQVSGTCALKNLSVIPELRQNLAEEGVVRIMIGLLNDDSEVLLVSKEYAAECLQNLTLGNDDDIKQSVITQGGLRSLLAYLDVGLPQEPAVRTVRNLAGSVSADTLISLGLLPRLAHVLKTGSTGAQTAAIGTICRICESLEVKKAVGESGCIPLLVKLLEMKANEVREVAAQALASLMTVGCNAREVKRDARSVPSLVQLLDPSAQNTAKKYAVCCLGILSRCSNKCRKVMISYGAIGYLKKLTEMDIIGSKKLLERLQRGKFRSFLG